MKTHNMTIKEVIRYLEELAPLHNAEDFDNVGLLTGSKNTEVKGVLVTLDTLETVVDEAIAQKCNMIVSFHPIIFKGLKSLTGKNYVERAVIKAIKNDIAIYTMHTALDNSFKGVNAEICKRLNLKNRRVLIPKKSSIKKLVTYVPTEALEQVKNALFEIGAGNIGNYDNCSFSTTGIGSFKGNEESNPQYGEKHKLEHQEESMLNMTFSNYLESKIVAALKSAHPYEEVAYEITTLENSNQHLGMGMIGELESPMSELDFLNMTKQTFKAGGIRHSALLDKKVRTVAVLGGSGSFAIQAAKAQGADAYITADLKYHDFFQAENDILLVDIGHFESEQFTKELLYHYIQNKFTNFATVLSKTTTNPIKYL